MKFRATTAIYLSLAFFFCSACHTTPPAIDYSNGKMVASWVENLTEAVKVDMFSPPVASRIYSYANIAAYEVLRHTDSTKFTLSGRLNGLGPLPLPDANLDYDFRVAGLTAFSEVASALVYTKHIIQTFETSESEKLKKSGISNEVFKRSVDYGKLLAAEILKWAAADNFKQTRGMIRYTLLHQQGSWEPTPPDFMQGAEPHWKKIRPFALDSAAQFRPATLPVAFSTDTGSEFYKNALAIVTESNSSDSSNRVKASFWDDNPGVSSVYGHMKHIKKKMTPGGHWMAITAIVVNKRQLSMANAAELYAVSAVAITDAFIACWDSKYYFQTIRPITYIHRNITTDWQPLLQTPPFPEFPSGHATISAAAATVLTAYVGDNFAYTDSTEFRYGLPVRSFNSFMEAAEECAQSRFYGGIHFMPSNQAGTVMGVKTGNAILDKLRITPTL